MSTIPNFDIISPVTLILSYWDEATFWKQNSCQDFSNHVMIHPYLYKQISTTLTCRLLHTRNSRKMAWNSMATASIWAWSVLKHCFNMQLNEMLYFSCSKPQMMAMHWLQISLHVSVNVQYSQFINLLYCAQRPWLFLKINLKQCLPSRKIHSNQALWNSGLLSFHLVHACAQNASCMLLFPYKTVVTHKLRLCDGKKQSKCK